MRRGLDELKGLLRAVSVSSSQAAQSAANFGVGGEREGGPLALQPVYISTDGSGQARAVVPNKGVKGVPRPSASSGGVEQPSPRSGSGMEEPPRAVRRAPAPAVDLEAITASATAAVMKSMAAAPPHAKASRVSDADTAAIVRDAVRQARRS